MICPICNGKGEINNEFTKYMESCGQWRENEVQTNEEWIKSMTTEELAEWLRDAGEICSICEYWDDTNCSKICPYGTDRKKAWEKWLKQPHTSLR